MEGALEEEMINDREISMIALRAERSESLVCFT